MPIRTKENITRSLWELKLKTNELLEVQEKRSDQVLICFWFASAQLEGGAKFPDWSQSEGNQHPCHPALLLTLKRKMLQLPQLKIPVQLLVAPWWKPLFLQLHNTWKKKWIIIKREITDNFKFSSSNKISWWTETKAKIKQNKKIAQNHFCHSSSSYGCCSLPYLMNKRIF